MLRIKSLRKRISDRFMISIEDLSIKDGEIIALIGNNGSGKTILLNSILNNIKLDSGDIEIGGINHKLDMWKSSTGVYMNTNYLLDFMTPIEYFSFISEFYNISKKDLPIILEEFDFLLGPDKGLLYSKTINKLSRGTKDKIGIIGASFYHPKLLIFDEPFSHLDTPAILFLVESWTLMNEKFNSTLIISSPSLYELEAFSTRIILMEDGQIKYDFINSSHNISKIRDYFTS